MRINKMKPALLGSVLVAASAAHAEGSVTVDTTAAGQAVDAVGTAISGLLTGNVMTNVLLVLGAGLAIAMIFMAVRWILRGGKTAAKG